MDNYIQVEDGEEPYYLPVSNNTLPLETLQSAFPRCCGLCFYFEDKCFVVKLQRGILYPPKEYWKFCFEPIFNDDYDEYEDENEDEYEDDEYYHDEGYDKTNVGIRPQQKEDINQLYYDLLKNNDNDDGDNDDLYSDDE